jgi:hypothetical protein
VGVFEAPVPLHRTTSTERRQTDPAEFGGRCRTVQIQAGTHTITAADPIPDDLRRALNRIHRETGTN